MTLSADLAEKSVQSAIAAIEIYSKPNLSYREEALALLMSQDKRGLARYFSAFLCRAINLSCQGDESQRVSVCDPMDNSIMGQTTIVLGKQEIGLAHYVAWVSLK